MEEGQRIQELLERLLVQRSLQKSLVIEGIRQVRDHEVVLETLGWLIRDLQGFLQN